MLREISFKIGEDTYINFMWCPPGNFKFGVNGTTLGYSIKSSKEAFITFTEGFWIATVPVTARIWNLVMDDNPAGPAVPPDMALYGIDYTMAISLIERINKRILLYTDKEVYCSLPNYLEWRYACLGKQHQEDEFYIKDGIKEFSKYAWFNENSNDHVHNVAGKEPNPWGIYDMYGNVMEMCSNVIPVDDNPIVTNPVGIIETMFTVLGGDYSSSMERCLSLKMRAIPLANSYMDLVGLRLVLRGI